MNRIAPRAALAALEARLVDGATEVHQQVLARHFMEEHGDFWRWA